MEHMPLGFKYWPTRETHLIVYVTTVEWAVGTDTKSLRIKRLPFREGSRVVATRRPKIVRLNEVGVYVTRKHPLHSLRQQVSAQINAEFISIRVETTSDNGENVSEWDSSFILVPH